MAQSDGATCSAAYHAALEQLRTSKGEALAGAVAALRAPDTALPGRWLYAQSLLAKPGARPRVLADERPCLEKARVAGRMRCTRFDETAPVPMPSEMTIAPAPTTDEMRSLKSLHDLVESRGAVPEVGSNGRYTWLAQRATADFKAYISQPAHPALCSGGKDFAEFYGNALKSLQKRIDDVTALAKTARSQALARLAEVRAAEPGGTAPANKD